LNPNKTLEEIRAVHNNYINDDHQGDWTERLEYAISLFGELDNHLSNLGTLPHDWDWTL
jgi:hypothetical protein